MSFVSLLKISLINTEYFFFFFPLYYFSLLHNFKEVAQYRCVSEHASLQSIEWLPTLGSKEMGLINDLRFTELKASQTRKF